MQTSTRSKGARRSSSESCGRFTARAVRGGSSKVEHPTREAEGRGFREAARMLLARAVKRCELCELARTTTWYVEYDEPFRFAILDCDSCDVPMAVLGAHRATPTDDERAIMQAALTKIADAKYSRGWYFDDHMRQIPEHYHLHARPYPAWWPRRF